MYPFAADYVNPVLNAGTLGNNPLLSRSLGDFVESRPRSGTFGSIPLLQKTLSDYSSKNIPVKESPKIQKRSEDLTPDDIRGFLEQKFDLERRGANVRMGMSNQDRFGQNVQSGALKMMGLI